MTDSDSTILSSNLFFLSSALSRKLSAEADKQFSEFGLSNSHALLLLLIDEHPNIQPSQLAEKLILKPSTITRLVNKLERRKLVEKTSEGRSSHIVCTSKGSELIDKLNQRWGALMKVKKQELGERYVSVLSEMMQQALQSIDA
ncbi:MAG TPA: MarR family transcriptional regulator [Fodinibius sp.]|nr:MarR family transcriptional regulator [Fodinibius sp.]